MELQLKNIGMIKEANVAIDGLTVIAGENDTGKSTASKALYLMIKGTQEKLTNDMMNNQAFYTDMNKFGLCIKYNKDDIFKQDIGKKNCYMELKINENNQYIVDLPNGFDDSATAKYKAPKDVLKNDILYLETPLIWNLTDFFRDTAQVESQMNIKLDYPVFMKDLNFKLHIQSASRGFDIKNKITSLMGGEFKKDEMGRYYFDKNGERIELVNTATGIKQFGLFQILSQNNYLNKDTILVLDEPEVHLHPKWQLEMAKIIVELVKSGVKVLVNSHSPYMIEALERYAEKAEVPSDFYLAEDGIIAKVEDDNSKTLAKIFHKLSAPYKTFDQMDSEILKGG